MITDKQYQEARKIIEQYIEQLQDKITEARGLTVKSPLTEKVGTYVSLRTWNVLRMREELDDPTIHEFAQKDYTENHLKRYRNFGKKSVEELNDMLNKFGYSKLRKS